MMLQRDAIRVSLNVMSLMLLNTVADTLDFIGRWLGHPNIVPENFSKHDGLPVHLPLVVSVSDKLGEVFKTDHYPPNLLEIQDTIFRPETIEIDEDGVNLFIAENQGVYRFGCKPDAPENLLVIGDWSDGKEFQSYYEWHEAPMSCDDALIMNVLFNSTTGFSTINDVNQEDSMDTRPSDIDCLLWHHPKIWPKWTGFWTNDAQTKIWWDGMGMTVSKT